MTSEKFYIKRIDHNHIESASKDIAEAFIEDSLMIHFIPEPEKRSKLLSKYFRFMLKLCNKYGYVYTTYPDQKGFALLLPSSVSLNISQLHLRHAGWFDLQHILGEETLERINDYNAYINKLHTKNMPEEHCYLDLIAVNPDYQRQGRATALIRHVIKRLDKISIPCYLVTQNDDNVPIYNNLGFTIIDKTNIPGTCINHWEMKREVSQGK